MAISFTQLALQLSVLYICFVKSILIGNNVEYILTYSKLYFFNKSNRNI